MEHDTARELLGARVEDDLDPDTAAQVDDHVAGCPECQREMASVQPVDLPGLTPSGDWSADVLRRGVRRTLWRTAFNAASLLLVVLIVSQLASSLVAQPLISRGNRAQRTLQAAVDLPVMLTPGAQLLEWRAESGLLDRTMWANVGLPVGPEVTTTGRFELSLRLLSVAVTPESYNSYSWTDTRWQPDELPPQARATVALVWDGGSAPAEVDRLGQRDGIGLLWAGFNLSDQPVGRESFGDWARPAFDAPPLPPTVLGYSTCQSPPIPEGAGGGTFSGSAGGGGASPLSMNGGGTTQGLENLRLAVANLAADTDLRALTASSGHQALAEIDRTAAWLADHQPNVYMAVFTGSVKNLRPVVAAAGPDRALQLGATLYNGDRPVCSSVHPAGNGSEDLGG